MALTSKQKKFVASYTGNATEAARLAGYSGNDVTLAAVGSENLRKPEIAAAIDARETRQTGKLIATREERQAFWTAVLLDVSEAMAMRLKASELLGKSQADFLDRVEVTGKLTLEQLVEQASKK